MTDILHFKILFLHNQAFCVLVQMFIDVYSWVLIGIKSKLIQLKACHRTGGDSLHKPMMTNFTDAHVSHKPKVHYFAFLLYLHVSS